MKVTAAVPRWSVVARVLAAIFGSLLVALAACVCASLLLPDPRRMGAAIGALFVIPVWVTGMSFGFLARSAWRPWAAYLGATALFAGLAWLLR